MVGIENDISFEEDFIKKYQNVSCFAFDGSINSLPKENNNIKFIKKYIGFENNDTVTNLHDIINANINGIFIKMDIEGGEIPWIKSLTNEQLYKFEQIVMEFHNPFSEKEIDVFEKINRNHYLIHFHGNNYCGVRNHNGVRIPNIFECTYLHKKYFENIPELNTELIPGYLDMKNSGNNENNDMDEIYINYPPFVNTTNLNTFNFEINNGIVIEYGNDKVKVDITNIVFNSENENGLLYIPNNDEVRGSLYNDPIFGVLKKIFIKTGNDKYIIESNDYAYIDINKNKLYINVEPI